MPKKNVNKYWRSLMIISMMLIVALPAWADPVVPGFDVAVYAVINEPMTLAFAPSGVLYVSSVNAVGHIYRIGIGGDPIETYGNDPLIDHPRGLAFDASGAFSGTPGSVLVGNTNEAIVAILPDQSTIEVTGIGGFYYTQHLRFDRLGRLLISDVEGLFVATGDSTTRIGSSPNATAVDGSNRVFVGGGVNRINVYAPDGRALQALTWQDDDAEYFTQLEFGPYDTVWQGHLFAAGYGTIYRVAPDGSKRQFGSGFNGTCSANLAFGPDGALYVADTCADVIYRITPSDDPFEFIVDNTDPGFSSGPSPWPNSKHIPGGYNDSYRYAPPGYGDQWASWMFTLDSTGNCKVSAQWTAFENRSTAAPYTIINNGTEIPVTADQTVNGGRFNSLGTYRLEAGDVKVVLHNTSDGYVIADAVKLSMESGLTMPVTVDNTDADFSISGAWGTSSFSSGYYGGNYRYATPDGGGKAATWTFSILGAGSYAIRAQWSAHNNRSPIAPYTIVNNGVSLGVEIANQTTGGGQFNHLGTFDLKAGTLEVILNDSPQGYVIADAVQIVAYD